MGQVSLHCSDPFMVLILLSFPFQNPELWVSCSTFNHNPRDSISQIFFSKGCCSTGLHGCKVIPWNHIFYFFLFSFYNFIYLFLAVLGLHCCAGFLKSQWAAAALHGSAQASRCGGLFCCQAQALGHVGFSHCGSWALEHRLNSCGARA